MERAVRGMKHRLLTGKRLHIAGSSTDNVDPEKLKYAHSLVKQIAETTLSIGGGLVVTIGSEPLLNNKEKLPKIFDWTLLEALDEFQDSSNLEWPVAQGAPVVAVGFQKSLGKIPPNRQSLWKRVTDGCKLDLRIIPREVSVGGVLRGEQSRFGDILVTLGGGPGTYHLKELYQTNRKPIIPLDLSLDKKKSLASEVLSSKAYVNPKEFFNYKPSRNAITAYSRLSLKNSSRSVNEFEQNFFDFLFHLPKPCAFYVRLLNEKMPEFNDVESFFRDVVDRIVTDSGYERFEMGTDTSEEAFLNVELFKKLHFSSLVIVDLTGVRPNCCLELGYVLALGKRIILTAKEGTNLPWDVETINCHFWLPNEKKEDRTKKLKAFMEKNMIRGPLKNTFG